MNFTDEIKQMISDEAIEEPNRTGMIITIGRTLGLTNKDILNTAYEALDLNAQDTVARRENPQALSPLHPYSVAPDVDGVNLKMTLAAMIETITGYDDDHDDMTHDLEHAMGMTGACDVHTEQPCANCCALCDEES